MNTSKRNESRKSYSNGPANGHAGRSKPRQMNRNITMEGVWGNARFSHGVASLIGCPVRVEVKNGAVYEGVFLTFSSKMEVVLQMAHRIEGKQDGPYNKDQVIDAIIFKAQDVLSVTATNVDLDYATKDTFTDAAISKFNGEVHSRELERWDGEGGPGCDLSLESGSNGWGAEDMFKTNAEKYNVKSSYDANLSAYTTPLEVDDTAEGKAKAARAARLASEIEGTDTYRQHAELENIDEGDTISAVSKETVLRDPATTDRYIPPALRKQFAAQQAKQVGKPTRVNGTSPGPDAGPPSPQPGALSSSAKVKSRESLKDEECEQDKNKKNVLSPPSSSSASPLPNSDSPSSPTPNNQSSADNDAKSDSSERRASPAAISHKPLQQSKSDNCRPDEEFPPPALSSSHHNKPRKPEHKKPKTDDLKAELNDLRDFSDNFKLSSDNEREKRSEKRPTEGGPDRATPQKHDSMESATSTDKDPAKKSTLNPNAPEFTFNPNAREFKPTMQATSPRPQTQSPVIQQIALHPHPGQQIFPYMTGPLINPGQMLPPEQQAMPKRAVVSVVRADPSAQAQALAATGTPLQAQPAGGLPGAPQYTLQPIVLGQNMAQNFAAAGQAPMYGQQMVHMTQNGHRLVSAAQMGAGMAQIQYQTPHQHQLNLQQQQHQQQQQAQQQHQQHQQQQMYLQQHASMAQAQAQQHPQQLMAQHQPPQGHHPQHFAGPPHPGSRSTPPQQAPQHAGQPQPQPQQGMFHPNGMGQPPLQPSPHTPASPQAQQPPVLPMSYTFSQPPIPTQTHNPAMHQMATNYMQVAPQVSYTAHHAHGPPPQNHVMMVQQHQLQQGGHPPHLAPHGPPQMGGPQPQVHMTQSHPGMPPQPGMAAMGVPTGQIQYAPHPSPR